MTLVSAICSEATLGATAPSVGAWIVLVVAEPWPRHIKKHNLVERFLRRFDGALSTRRARTVLAKTASAPARLIDGFPVRVLASRGIAPVALREWTWESGDFDEVDSVLAFLDGGEAPSSSPEELALVCTHIEYDSACGHAGATLAATLRSIDSMPVVECSHLAGCGYSPNLLFLPSGVFYGRLIEPVDVERAVAAHTSGKVLLRYYRGRTFLSRPAQAAERFALKFLQVEERNELSLESERELSTGTWAVTIRIGDSRLVTCRVESVGSLGETGNVLLNIDSARFAVRLEGQ